MPNDQIKKCKKCGVELVDIGNYGTLICPLNCMSPYTMCENCGYSQGVCECE